MSNPKKPLNEVDIFSDLSLTARRIISQLLGRNEKLQQENQLLKDKTKESLNDNIPYQSRSETLREINNNSKPHKRISSIAKTTKKLGVDSAVLSTVSILLNKVKFLMGFDQSQGRSSLIKRHISLPSEGMLC